VGHQGVDRPVYRVMNQPAVAVFIGEFESAFPGQTSFVCSHCPKTNCNACAGDKNVPPSDEMHGKVFVRVDDYILAKLKGLI
jgi:hypothetical protein